MSFALQGDVRSLLVFLDGGTLLAHRDIPPGTTQTALEVDMSSLRGEVVLKFKAVSDDGTAAYSDATYLVTARPSPGSWTGLSPQGVVRGPFTVTVFLGDWSPTRVEFFANHSILCSATVAAGSAEATFRCDPSGWKAGEYVLKPKVFLPDGSARYGVGVTVRMEPAS